nr:hypothetical protein [Tanacetum cinerariifolium]
MRSQCTYLRNMGGYKHSHLKGRSYDEIKKLFDREMKKKQKVDKNVEPVIDDTEELKKCMEIVPDDEDEVLIEATPISSRSPTIIEYKIHKKGKKNYFKIIRADGNSQVYQTFEKMFKNFNREDVKVLWAIVEDRFKKEKLVDDMDNLFFRTLKTMFEHHVEDTIWTYQQGLAKVKNWKLFESYGVCCITMQSTIYYLLVEKVVVVSVGGWAAKGGAAAKRWCSDDGVVAMWDVLGGGGSDCFEVGDDGDKVDIVLMLVWLGGGTKVVLVIVVAAGVMFVEVASGWGDAVVVVDKGGDDEGSDDGSGWRSGGWNLAGGGRWKIGERKSAYGG